MDHLPTEKFPRSKSHGPRYDDTIVEILWLILQG